MPREALDHRQHRRVRRQVHQMRAGRQGIGRVIGDVFGPGFFQFAQGIGRLVVAGPNLARPQIVLHLGHRFRVHGRQHGVALFHHPGNGRAGLMSVQQRNVQGAAHVVVDGLDKVPLGRFVQDA